jgi:hypothetical protein
MAFRIGDDAAKVAYFRALAATARMDLCQPWGGVIDRYGYGKVYFGGRTVKAHRVALELQSGPMPDAVAAHWMADFDPTLCPRSCVNWTHLEWMTGADNTRAGNSISARNLRRVVCKHGHPFSRYNTRVRSDGGRSCRECERTRGAVYRATRHAALQAHNAAITVQWLQRRAL